MDIKLLKVKTQKVMQYEEGESEPKEKYINLGYTPNGEIQLENLGYHFTPKVNFASIQETGLRPKIGSNSAGAFGREALEKTFFSYGKNGVMQLFNRLVSASCEMNMDGFRDDSEKAQYLLEYQKGTEFIQGEEQLTILEGLEYARRYMDNCSYFGFSAVEPQYTKAIDEETVAEDVMNVNQNLDDLKGVVVEDRLTDLEKLFIVQKVEAEIDKLKEKMKSSPENSEKYEKQMERFRLAEKFIKQGNIGETREVNAPRTAIGSIDKIVGVLDNKEAGFMELAGKLSQMRAQISIGIREESKKQIDSFRGEAIPESIEKANFERIDYNEDMVGWVDVVRHPHNAHTMIREENGEKKGVVIGGDTLSMLSLDGEKPATAVELTKYIFDRSPEAERSSFVMNIPGRKTDALIIEDFYQYVDLYHTYREDPAAFQAKMREFESGLLQKYSGSHLYNVTSMSDERMKAFSSEVTKEKLMEAR